MAELSPKQLRILKFLSENQSWRTRQHMEEKVGRKGFSAALGTPTKDVLPFTLEGLGFVRRRDDTIPYEYQITDMGIDVLSDHERRFGSVQLCAESAVNDAD